MEQYLSFVQIWFTMLKKLIALALGSVTQLALAANGIELYQAPFSSINSFTLTKKSPKATLRPNAAAQQNQLEEISQTKINHDTVIRYQQVYKGIPVIGAQVSIRNPKKAALTAANADARISGHLMEGIELNTQPTLTSDEVISLAKKNYLHHYPATSLHSENSQLQIRSLNDKNPQLVYQISFKAIRADKRPAWPFLILDAQTGRVLMQWDNIENWSDTGPGGNEKTGEYWFGKDDLPALEVVKNGESCVMDDSRVRLVDLHSSWDWYDKTLTAYHYVCGQNTEENVNGGFSPINDAYYFGHTVIDMYQQWYGQAALQNVDGSPMPLIMRVHFGENYDNAFWDGATMSFGDGSLFYPLVSLDVAGHEVTHGFTEQHSGLEYHDESGALNESFSDMAGQAARAYLQEKHPLLFHNTNLGSDEMSWGIGESIVRDAFGSKALRFMDNPSADGISADCLDPQLAKNSGSECRMSFEQLMTFASMQFPDTDARQSFIVHTASGIFNKAFYLLSENKTIGIKKAYHTMLLANTYYWTPVTDFKKAACGVLYAARDLKLDTIAFKRAFNQVGIETGQCMLSF